TWGPGIPCRQSCASGSKRAAATWGHRERSWPSLLMDLITYGGSARPGTSLIAFSKCFCPCPLELWSWSEHNLSTTRGYPPHCCAPARVEAGTNSHRSTQRRLENG